MAQPFLADLTASAATADGPRFPSAISPRPGGVDPLGLRQINFDLMDQVLPGLNNVARHIRPFVLVAWAWRRAANLARSQGQGSMLADKLCDFVDRLEVIYTWSQFLRDPNADLPGRRVLGPLLRAQRWVFGGDAWRKRREDRRYSTSFTAPINYGPGLKALGWVEPHREHPEVLIATLAAEPALVAFEAMITDRLDHPAFSQFGTVEVTSAEVSSWADAWALENVTEVEARIMAEMLQGSRAPLKRQAGFRLVLAAAAQAASRRVDQVRITMTGSLLNFAPSDELQDAVVAWRRVQVRQLFRLALEALLYWILRQIEGEPRTTSALVEALLGQIPDRPTHVAAREWLDRARVSTVDPTALMERISQALGDPAAAGLPSSIVDGIAFCLEQATERGDDFERIDRLPLYRARREAEAWSTRSARDFIRHIIEFLGTRSACLLVRRARNSRTPARAERRFSG